MIAAIRQVVRDQEVTAEEYDGAARWLSEAGRQDCLAGILEHLVARTVAEVGSTPDATPQNPEGPYYLPDSPLLSSPCSSRMPSGRWG